MLFNLSFTRIFIFLAFAFHFTCIAKKEHNISQTMRIVSLAPHLTEIIFALGAEEQLVGNTTYCNYPEVAKKIYKIGDFLQPNLERIIAIKPTHVLATEGNNKTLLNQFQKQGYRILYTDFRSLRDLNKSIHEVGKFLNRVENAKIISEKLQHSIHLLKLKKLTGTFLLTLQVNPIYSVSENTWINDLFTYAGLTNIIQNKIVKYPVVSEEYLLRQTPDFIFINPLENKSSEESFLYQKKYIRKIYGIDKIPDNRIILLPKDIFMRPGPRIIEAINFILKLNP